jgi:hypothetical protein
LQVHCAATTAVVAFGLYYTHLRWAPWVPLFCVLCGSCGDFVLDLCVVCLLSRLIRV